ncbi:CesT family type III secretion system chaperone [Acanthopleuribacter pedis]|uniref:Type III secretion system chaperone n=1 Tax=Acanthopleuribacter pedis TaxID=442870 RepID=A0A8J7U5G3_9BACT|nr:CesT family type III secretion system chaperone [Acanthopleuribacter pedis]MBO1320413.1 type III secretion system chaperone [Acanthopleuribacter pedis]
MSITQTMNQWLEVIGAIQGESLQLSPEGTAAFVYGEEVEVVVSVDDQSPVMFFLAVIIDMQDLEEDLHNQILGEAMRLNLYKQVTAGGSLAFDQHHTRLVLNKSVLVAELSPEQFVAELEPFGQAALQLVQTFRGESASSAPEEDEEQPPQNPPQIEPPPPLGWRA